MVEKKPAKKAAAKKTPAKKTPAKKTPAKKTPAKKAVAKRDPSGINTAPLNKAPLKSQTQRPAKTANPVAPEAKLRVYENNVPAPVSRLEIMKRWFRRLG